MTITTVADALANCTTPIEHVKTYSTVGGSLWKSTWFEAGGFQSAALAPSAGLAGTSSITSFSTTYFPYSNPPVGQKKYLCKVSGTMLGHSGGITVLSTNGSYYMADRLWHNNGLSITSTAVQTIDSVAFAARDANGTADGEGVWLGLEIGTANLGAATSVITISYTNSAGVAGRTGTIDQTVFGGGRGWVLMMRADTGDTGVRSVQTYQSSASLVSGGPIYLVAFRPLVFIHGGYGKNYRSYFGPFDLGFPEFPNGCVPMLGSNSSLNSNVGMYSEWTFAEG